MPTPVATAAEWAAKLDKLAAEGAIPPRNSAETRSIAEQFEEMFGEKKQVAPVKKQRRKKAKAPVKVPHITNKDDGTGRVEFYVRAYYDEDGKLIIPSVSDFKEISSRINPDYRYKVFVKDITPVGPSLREHQLEHKKLKVGGREIKGPLIGPPGVLVPKKGLEWGIQKGPWFAQKKYPWMLREPYYDTKSDDPDVFVPAITHDSYEVDYAWRHLPVIDWKSQEPKDVRLQYGKTWTPGRFHWLIEKKVFDEPPDYLIGRLISMVPLTSGATEWLAMRAGSTNCVAASVMASLSKAHALTPEREKIIRDWVETPRPYERTIGDKARWKVHDEWADLIDVPYAKHSVGMHRADAKFLERLTGHNVRDDGASYYDTDILATKLKMRLQFYDVAGTLLHEKAGKNGPAFAKGHMVIKVYRSDGHCSGGEPHFVMPEAVVVTAGPMLKPSRGKSETGAQTRAREKENNDARERYIVDTIRKYNLVRAQIVGSEIIAQKVLYRPLALDMQMHATAEKLQLRPPACTASYDNPGLYSCTDDPTEEDPSGYKAVDIPIHVGGVQSFYLKHWLKAHNIKALWPASREGWRQATIEAVPWTAEGAKLDEAEALYDMRAAFMACDSRPAYAAGPAHEYAARFGFPRGGRTRKCLASTWEEVVKLAGHIRYKTITIAPHAPAAIAAHLAHHFRNGPKPIAIPAAIWLHEHGYIGDYSILDVEYTDRISGLKFPTNRDLGVRLIGSCAYKNSMRTFYTSDEAECAHFTDLYSSFPQAIADGFLVSFPVSQTTTKVKDHSHIRTYALAYQTIAMWTAIEALGDNLIRTATDSVLVKNAAEAEQCIPTQSDEYAIKWGEFRPKPIPKIQASGIVGAPAVQTWTSEETTTATVSVPAIEALARTMTAYIEPAGFGKTTRALKEADASGRKTLILVGINVAQAKIRDDLEKMAKEKVMSQLAEIEANMDNFEVDTYQHFFHLPEKHSEWTPMCMGMAGIRRDIIIWDEFAMAGLALLQIVLPWMRNVGLTTILCGDPIGQLQEFGNPHSGQQVMKYLETNEIPIDHGEGIDWRARDCPTLQAAKRAAWCQSDATQLNELKKIATPLNYADTISLWEPGDIVIEATNRIGETIENDIRDTQIAKYGLQGRADVMFKVRGENEQSTKDLRKAYCTKKNGVLGTVRTPEPGFHYVQAAIGTVVSTTLEATLTMNTELWKLASRTTVHSVQGVTIGRERKIFICLESIPSEWCRNAIYVSMSRAELASQLYVFNMSSVAPTRPMARKPRVAPIKPRIAPIKQVATPSHTQQLPESNQIAYEPVQPDPTLSPDKDYRYILDNI